MVHHIRLAQGMVNGREELINKITNLKFPQNADNFCSTRTKLLSNYLHEEGSLKK